MEPPVHFVLGSREAEHLAVEVRRRSHAGATDYWDGNWLTCAVSLRAGGFRATVDASLRAEEFVRFRDEVARLHSTLSGEAVFLTTEEWLELRLIGDGRGHVVAHGELRDQAGVGNLLKFSVMCDQTDLPALVRDLEGVLAAFPVIGQP